MSIRRTLAILGLVLSIICLCIAPSLAEYDEWICTQCYEEAFGDFCMNCAAFRPEQTIAPRATPAPAGTTAVVTLEVGDVYEFGTYHTYTRSDQEPIRWIVLEVRNNRALLLSEHVLDAMAFDEDGHVEWADSSIRAWLNGTFLNAAFTETQRGAILTTQIGVSSDDQYVVWSASNTRTDDKVFLLSYAEVNNYFGANMYYSKSYEARASATAYAQWAGAPYTVGDITLGGQQAVNWWLRTRGQERTQSAYVASNGRVDPSRPGVNAGVRPAIWVDLTSEALLQKEPAAAQTTSDAEVVDQVMLSVGDTFTMGQYFRENEWDREPIWWQVIALDGTRALVISQECLDAGAFADSTSRNSWYASTARKWLNGSFLDGAFTEEEQSAILMTQVDNSLDQGYIGNRKKENDTSDRIFLLSYDEAVRYVGLSVMHDSPSAVAKVTPLARSRGAYNDNGPWWLRSCGTHGDVLAVDWHGRMQFYTATSTAVAIRPAMWIDLSNEWLVSTFGRSAASDPAAEQVNGDESSAVTVGQKVSFGRYYVSFEGETAPIQWQVLEVQDGAATLISVQSLDAKPMISDEDDQYCTEQYRYSWPANSMRDWLNGEFYRTAFNAQEQAAILTTTVSNGTDEGYSGWKTSGAADTQDKVYLLSYAEADRFFNIRYGVSNTILDGGKATQTAYTAALSWTRSASDGVTGWWLRSPAPQSEYGQQCVAYVNNEGRVIAVDVYEWLPVRPVIRVDVNALT